MVKVLSLFDGISCGRVAFERAGIRIDEYHACEIDQYAIRISKSNYPDIVHHGSVTEYHPDRSFDYVIGGSPCQGFSFAGKQLAFDDPRSKLFFEYVRILKEVKSLNPNVKFLLENVQMKQEYLDVISEELGVSPVKINSSLVSAQNRVRYYWANWEITQPEDKGILWKDIQLDNADKVMYYSEAAFNWIFKSPKRKEKYLEYTKDSAIKMQMLEASHHKGYSNQRCFGINDSGRIRYIHPIECERLQTLPDNYTKGWDIYNVGVSNTQRYRCLGNGWTVDVIAHILKDSCN